MPPLGPIPDGDGFTLVHSADLHLGSGMRIAKRLGRLDDLKDATYEALDNLVGLVEQEDADILTLGGDLFDEPNLRNPGPRHRLAAALARIPETRVAIVRGNHDHHHRDAPQVRWPENVFEFSGNKKTLDLDSVRIHGVSYTSPRETESMLHRYPRPTGAFDIGLLHANVGSTAGHQDYAPCTATELQDFGYRMWLLGHIHKRQVICEDPLILYPGNLQGRDAGETGEKTAEVIEVSGAGVITHHPEPVHRVLWERMDIDVGGTETKDEAIDRLITTLDEVRAGLTARGLITRLTLTGTTRAHRDLIRTDPEASAAEEIQEILNDRYGDRERFLLVDRIEVKTSVPIDLDRLAASDDISGLLVRMADEPDLQAEILQELADGGPAERHELERLAAGLWPDALQAALVRLHGRDADAY